MDSQKVRKAVSTALASVALSAAAVSQVSIGGTNAINSQYATEEIETKYGSFTAKGGFPVERYESGAVKSFYAEDYGGKVPLKIPMKNFGFGELYFETPSPRGEDVLSRINAHPIEFWENGNVKSVYIGNFQYDSLDGDKHLKIKLPKYKYTGGLHKGQMQELSVFPKSVVSFYESGALKSFKVADGQTLNFLRSMGKTDAQRARQLFKNQSEIEFYENGSIKRFTPISSAVLTYKNPLGFAIKGGTEITVSPDDETVLTSFYPVPNSSLSLGENIIVNILNTVPVAFYDDGKTLKQISWQFKNLNFTLGNIQFLSTEEVTTRQTVVFGEDGAILSVSGIESESIDGSKTKSSYLALYDGHAVLVHEIDYDADGRPTVIHFSRLQEIAASRTADGIQTVSAWKVYYKDGKKRAAVGNVHLQNAKGSFYNQNYNCIIVMDGDEIVKTIKEGSEEVITGDSTVIFGENGAITGYTASDADRNAVETKIE